MWTVLSYDCHMTVTRHSAFLCKWYSTNGNQCTHTCSLAMSNKSYMTALQFPTGDSRAFSSGKGMSELHATAVFPPSFIHKSKTHRGNMSETKCLNSRTCQRGMLSTSTLNIARWCRDMTAYSSASVFLLLADFRKAQAYSCWASVARVLCSWMRRQRSVCACLYQLSMESFRGLRGLFPVFEWKLTWEGEHTSSNWQDNTNQWVYTVS